MEILTALFAVFVIVATGLAGITVWARRRLAIKVAALALAAVVLPLGYGALAELLGRPKPTTLEWAREAIEEATILGASVREDVAIYLWLEVDASEPPIAYALPWSRRTAEQLQQAMREAESNGTAARMRRPFQQTLSEDESRFFAEPHQALPPKVHGSS